MDNFLRKIKLIEDYTFSLQTTKNDFVASLRNNIDEADIDHIFSGAFEVFSSSKHDFKGQVNYAGFKIRKRKRFFDRQFGFAKAIGTYKTEGEQLIVSGNIKGWNNFMYFFYGFLFLIYTTFSIGFVLQNDSSEFSNLVPLFFIFFHGLFMMGLPYVAMRSGVKRLQRDLERELHYIVSKNKN